MTTKQIKERVKFLEEQRADLIAQGDGMSVLSINEILYALKERYKKALAK